MVIISKTHLTRFGRYHPDAAGSLNDWYRKTKAASWSSFAEVRQTFPTADYVGNDRVVFNIRGNRYRLVVMIFYSIRTVFIRFAGTHKVYDRVKVNEL